MLMSPAATTVAVLCVDPMEQDRTHLEEIFNSCPWKVCPDALWKLHAAHTVESAWRMLRASSFPVILCECEIGPGAWQGLLALLERLPQRPFLIVTSRVADERLWAEALNLGAYNVLAKPFDRAEVTRVLSMAWMNWQAQHSAMEEEKLAAWETSPAFGEAPTKWVGRLTTPIPAWAGECRRRSQTTDS